VKEDIVVYKVIHRIHSTLVKGIFKYVSLHIHMYTVFVPYLYQ